MPNGHQEETTGRRTRDRWNQTKWLLSFLAVLIGCVSFVWKINHDTYDQLVSYQVQLGNIEREVSSLKTAYDNHALDQRAYHAHVQKRLDYLLELCNRRSK